ncbi:MAG: hypothetical protein DMF30_05315 [Verrucomicrobia bacterium]|nr:MAG: hypothetical protein DMF30_05315 [Verrucomicrobiota bacterium]
MTKEQILNEIKRIAADNSGVPPGKQRFSTETGISESAWSGKYWARWGDALREAGFPPNVWQVPHQEEFLIESYIRLIRELGRFPVLRELRLKRRADSSFPSTGSLNRFGSKATTASRIIKLCRARGGYDDVIKLCETFATEPAARAEAKADAEPEFGFVYLLKSGRHYKIGRSDSAGRREYELAIQLPEKATKIHEIRTDDPPGIEAYWHNRFEAKRRGGEWFDLDASDVNAFKRRKFM